MKKSNFKKAYTPEKAVHNKILTSLKKALKIGAEARSASDFSASTRGVSDTFLAHNELQRMNGQLLRAETQRAETAWLIRDKRRCL